MNICKHTQPIYNMIQFASFLLLLSTRKIIISSKLSVLSLKYCTVLSFYIWYTFFKWRIYVDDDDVLISEICRLVVVVDDTMYHHHLKILYVLRILLLNASETVLLLLQSYFFFFPMKGEFLKLTYFLIYWMVL